MTETGTAAPERAHVHNRLLWFALAMAMVLATAIFEDFGLFTYFLASIFSIIALVFAAAMNWKLHTRPWLWVALSSFALLHIPLILFIGKYAPIKGHIDGRGVVAIALADAASMTGVIRFPSFLKEFIDGFRDPKAERMAR